MMIRLTNMKGLPCLVIPQAIARVNSAGPNGSGVGAYVKMQDGEVLEVQESVDEISQRIEFAYRMI